MDFRLSFVIIPLFGLRNHKGEVCVCVCWGGGDQTYVRSLGLSSVLTHNPKEGHPRDDCSQLARRLPVIVTQPDWACFSPWTTGFQRTQLWGSKRVLPITSSTDSTTSGQAWGQMDKRVRRVFCGLRQATVSSPLHRTLFSPELLSVPPASHQHNLS